MIIQLFLGILHSRCSKSLIKVMRERCPKTILCPEESEQLLVTVWTSQQQLLSLLLQQLQALQLNQQVIILFLLCRTPSYVWLQAPRALSRISLSCMLAVLPPACCDLPKRYAAGGQCCLPP